MEIPRHWRLKKQRYGLVGNICPSCDTKYFPPVLVCRMCKDDDRSNDKTRIVYDSGLLFSPNDQVVHGEVVRQNQE